MAAPMSKQLFVQEGSKKFLWHTACIASPRLCSSNTKYERPSFPLTSMVGLKPHLLRRLKKLHPVPVKKDHKNQVFASFTKADFDRKFYARFGISSGVQPGNLWPEKDSIERELMKLELQKPLEERIADIRLEKEAKVAELAKHQQHVCDRMAKMDTYLQQYQQRKDKRLEKERQQMERRKVMLEEAREFFGYEVNHNDAKFRQMVEWKEEQEKRAKKLQKKKSKESYFADKVAKLAKEISNEKS